MHRALSRKRLRLDVLAEQAGRFAGLFLRGAPGVGGAVLISVGLGQIYRPLFLLGAGAFLLLIDRNSR